MLSASCFITCRDMVGILGECFWRLLERVCIITHTTWILKTFHSFLYMCFLLYSLTYLTENIFHAELPISLHNLSVYFLNFSPQSKKGNLKFQKMPSSSLRHSFLLYVLMLYSLQLKRHPIWAGERSVSWAFPGRGLPACCQKWASREGQGKWAGLRQWRAEP